MENAGGDDGFTTLPAEATGVPDMDLRTILDAWVDERPRTLYKQRGVRQDIANSIFTDILDPVGGDDIPQKVQDYRKNVDSAIISTIENLNNQPTGENGIIKKSQTIKDSVTGIKFFTQLRRNDTSWISEEINEDGNEVISRAEIGDRGELKLTLNFSGQRYEERGANPKLENSSEYPTGTKTLFLKHAATVGVISWSGKFLLK
jgi:hypothetical protein